MIPLISVSEALADIGEKNIVIVDARGGADGYARYTAGHIEGAYFADLETDLSNKKTNAAEGGRHPLPDLKTFGAFLGKIGITPDTTVITYDDKGGANAAARFWWMMKAIGHSEIHVIDGGLQAMIVAGAVPVNTLPSFKNAKPYPVNSWKSAIATIDDVTRAAADPDYLVVDVRESYRYRGESEPIDQVAGHIPGAVNIPYTSNLDADGCFLSSDALVAKYKKAMAGRKPENVIVHCGSGVTACHTLLALEEAEIIGAQLYVGSWSEWSRNDKPVARGE
jgi:thiosulfate/3-mercaptopyruvate sulfurtransferase